MAASRRNRLQEADLQTNKLDSHNYEVSMGAESIKSFLQGIYPDQGNHLQATAIRKFWLGGPDPLDHVHIFSHPGDSSVGSPPHWHYITCGFSDLHGDGRTHQFMGPNKQSGFGFELTFRLRKKKGEGSPLWPATLLNSLARYVFNTGNMLNCGDVIPWQEALEAKSTSVVHHLLVTEDIKLGSLDTPHGTFQFRQIVGITESEMKAAQKWRGKSVVELMEKVPETGGGLLVTDIDRSYSLFEYSPSLQQTLACSADQEGSNLGHVTAACQWHESEPQRDEMREEEDEGRVLSKVEIILDTEAAELLPVAIRGRLMKGHFFVYQNISGQVIIFIPPEFTAEMVLVTPEEPLKSQGDILQIYCTKDFINQLAEQFTWCQDPKELKKHLPCTVRLQLPDLSVTVVPAGQIPIEIW